MPQNLSNTIASREFISYMGIGDLEQRDITQASGGQLQRAGIVRALMSDPIIIFGDEPTGSLNSKSTGEILQLLADIHHTGTTILLVTHDVRVAARAERVLYMFDGRIIGNYQAGAYDEAAGDLKAREERLSEWLAGMGF